MQLKKFEQSGFLLETDSGFALAMDIGAYTPLETLEGVHADAMIVSHIHGDHFSLDQIRKIAPKTVYLNRECLDALGEAEVPFEIVEVTAGQKIMIGPVSVEFFNVDHGPNVSAPLAENFGFLITADNQTVYFAGDMYYPSGIDVTSLAVDIALIPVGGHYTFGPAAAFAFVQQFKSIGTLISMHYQKNNNVDPSQHEAFLALAQQQFNCS